MSKLGPTNKSRCFLKPCNLSSAETSVISSLSTEVFSHFINFTRATPSFTSQHFKLSISVSFLIAFNLVVIFGHSVFVALTLIALYKQALVLLVSKIISSLIVSSFKNWCVSL